MFTHFVSFGFYFLIGSGFADGEAFSAEDLGPTEKSTKGLTSVRVIQIVSAKYKLSDSILNRRKKSIGLPPTKQASITDTLQPHLLEKGPKREGRPFTASSSFPPPPPSGWKKFLLNVLWT